jgi:hypothetical protein
VFETCAIIWGLQVIPVALAGLKAPGVGRTCMIVCASVLALLAAGMTGSILVWHTVNSELLWAHLIGCLGSTWLSNIVASARPARKG